MNRLVAILIFLVSLTPVWAEDLYVCSGGDGSAPTTATCATAWDEADFNNAANWGAGANLISAGDTVNLMSAGGNLSKLTFRGSGSSGNVITMQPYSTNTVTVAQSGSDHAITLSGGVDYITLQKGSGTFNVSHTGSPTSIKAGVLILATTGSADNITIDGLTITGNDQASNVAGSYAANNVTNLTVKNVTVTDCTFGFYEAHSDGNTVSDFLIQDSTFNSNRKGGIASGSGESITTRGLRYTIDNVTANGNGDDGFNINNWEDVVIKDSTTNSNNNTGIQIEYNAIQGIIRNHTADGNSISSNSNETGIWVDEAQDWVIEKNTVSNNKIGFQIGECQRCIVRLNVAYTNTKGGGDGSFTSGYRWNSGSGTMSWSPGDHYMIYHNVAHANGRTTGDNPNRSGSMVGLTVGSDLTPQIIRNNVIYESAANFEVVTAPGFTSSDHDYNHYYNSGRSLAYFWEYSSQTATTWENTTQSTTEIAVGSTDPAFVDAANRDYTLTGSSPLVDAAGPLTTVTSINANDIVVGESVFFFDGYGIAGETGDQIAIFDDADWSLLGTCTITAIDYSTDTITCDSAPGGVGAGDYVNLATDRIDNVVGSRPEIGAYWRPTVVANAGPDQSGIAVDDLVTLDGTNSTGVTSYLWSQVAGTAQTLSDTTASQPTFTVAGSGGETLRFQLSINGGVDTDTVDIFVDGGGGGNTCTASNDAAGYARAVPITIAAGQVSGGPHSNFPFYKCVTDNNLKTTGNGGQVTDAQGDDIIPADTSGNLYDFERISYDGVAGTVCMWIEEPSVAGSDDVCLFAGNSSVTTTQEDAAGVWDLNGFEAVWHLEEDPSGGADAILDSSGNANHGTSEGTMVSGDLVAAQIDNGLDFDGSDDSFDLASPFTELDITGPITLEAWVNLDAAGSTSSFIAANSRYILQTSSGALSLRDFSGDLCDGDSTLATNAWVYVVGVFTGVDTDSMTTSNTKLYINGGSNDCSSPGTTWSTSSLNNISAAENTAGGNRLNGTLDEVRIHSVARSNAWVTTSYNNMNAPDTFSTVGTWEDVSSATADAGPDQSVDELDTVTLDCSGSTGETTRIWTQTAGTSVTLSDPEVEQPTFDVPAGTEGTTLTFQCSVDGGASTDTVDINVNALSVTYNTGASTPISSFLWQCDSEVTSSGYVSVFNFADGKWWVHEAPDGNSTNPGGCTQLNADSWQDLCDTPADNPNIAITKKCNEVGIFPIHCWLTAGQPCG